MKLGIIGLGDIAMKAYLPVYSGIKGIQFHLYTRDQTKLVEVGEKYRFTHLHSTIESLISSGIQGAFVHSATESHFEVVEKLLNHNIHVYVDKPITYHFDTTKKLISLAESKNLIVMAGFNRRYAPTYRNVKELRDPNMIIMQKNRKGLQGDIRKFVFDDFIHVVDTLLYLFPHPIEDLVISGRKKDNLLYHVVLQIVSRDCTAIGIMNRDSGTIEEKLEVMNSHEKRVVTNVSDLVIKKEKNTTNIGYSDWEPTLQKRGFESVISNFIDALSTGSSPLITNKELLLTHNICEKVVRKLSCTNEL